MRCVHPIHTIPSSYLGPHGVAQTGKSATFHNILVLEMLNSQLPSICKNCVVSHLNDPGSLDNEREEVYFVQFLIPHLVVQTLDCFATMLFVCGCWCCLSKLIADPLDFILKSSFLCVFPLVKSLHLINCACQEVGSPPHPQSIASFTNGIITIGSGEFIIECISSTHAPILLMQLVIIYLFMINSASKSVRP